MSAARAFGQHVTMKDVMAKQTRIERQDKAKIESVSFDRFAADSFQLYVQGKYKLPVPGPVHRSC